MSVWSSIFLRTKSVCFCRVEDALCCFMKVVLLLCGAALQIESQKLEWKASSKIGSLNNTGHKAGGGEKKVGQL
jgi:hypothetical protein